MNGNNLYCDAKQMNSCSNAHVQLRIMGHFSLQINGHLLSESDRYFSKRRSIVTYLILHRDRAVSHDELFRCFYEDEDQSNITAALKMQIGRIRKVFKNFIGEETDVIITKRGSYQWNPALTCWVDIEAFDSLCLAAQSETASTAEKMSLYSQALEMYGGTVLEKDGFLWGKTLSSQHHARYLAAVEQYAELLATNGRHEDAEAVYMKAIEHDSTNEVLYALLIRVLVQQNKLAEAKAWYKTIQEALTNTLGVQPSTELHQLYFQCFESKMPWQQDLSSIIEDMREVSTSPGAFLCNFEQFKNIYQLEVRRAKRDGGCLHVVLLNVHGFDGTSLSPVVNKIIIPRVQQAIMQNLRQSDVVAQYSVCQFIIMLPYANLEDSQMVVNRIIKAYHMQNPKNAIQFSYQIRELD